jgi:hypothetical protein
MNDADQADEEDLYPTIADEALEAAAATELRSLVTCSGSACQSC